MKNALFAVALAALTSAGCTVIVGGSVNDSCESDADCTDLGFSGATCDATKKQCVVAGGQPCETSEECEKSAGKPSICRADKVCAQLTSSDCAEVFGDYKNPDAIVLGFLGPLVGDNASTGVPIHHGAKLALNEIQQNAVGLPGPNSSTKPLAMVFCDDLSAPADDPFRAAKHLVNDVKVPAIIGPAFSGVALNTAKEVTIPGGTLLISASATSPQLTGLSDKGLVWRTCPSDAIQAIPLSALVTNIEDQIRTEQMLTMTDQIRVTMTVKGDAYGTGLADAVTPLLKFNFGKTAAQNSDNFKRVDYPDPSKTPNLDYSTVISQVVDKVSPPNIVLLFGTSETAINLIGGIEDAWDALNPTPPKPYYLIPDGGKVAELLSAIGGDDGLRKRVRGTVPGVAGMLYDSFKLRYKALFASDPKYGEPLAYADTGYDAAYLLAYAIVSEGDKPLTGALMNDGLKHMSKGTAISAGPMDINKAFSALQSAHEIDYTGASGPLNFDPNTGEAKADIDIWCVARKNGQPLFQSSGQRYDAVKDTLVGTYNDQGQCN